MNTMITRISRFRSPGLLRWVAGLLNRDVSTKYKYTVFVYKGHRVLCKGAEFPIQTWTGPSGCRELRLSEFCRESAHVGGKIFNPTHRPSLTPKKYPWYSFLLEADSTPVSQFCRKDYVNKKNPNDTIENRTRDLSACSERRALEEF